MSKFLTMIPFSFAALAPLTFKAMVIANMVLHLMYRGIGGVLKGRWRNHS